VYPPADVRDMHTRGVRRDPMRKPISKHGLRRALDRVQEDGHIEFKAPAGTVVDKIWHELEKRSYGGSRKKPIERESLRTAPLADGELDAGN
jgi:hypothetical protein